MSREFTSVLAGDMRAFIEFKHAAGVAFVGGQYLLGRLDAYLTATGAQGLTKDAVEGFIADYDGDRVGADRSYFSYLRGFAKFMRIRGLEAYELDPVFNRSKEPVNLFVYGVVGRDYPKYVCCFGRDV